MSSSPLIIVGLHSERPRSGKSTVAAVLAAQRGGRVFSIASNVRACARNRGLAAAADAVGDAKNEPHPDLGGRTPREVLIEIGQEHVRKFGLTYWVNLLFMEIHALMPNGGVVIIDDVRRVEEGEFVLAAGGTVCTLEREGAPNVVDINGWKSGFAYTFRNNGTPDECANRIWNRVVRDRRGM